MFKTAIAALALSLPLSAAAVAPAAAHFLLPYAPQVLLEDRGDLPLKLVFWHPHSVGPAMQMARPESIWMVHRETRVDLSASLSETVFDPGLEESAGHGESGPVAAWSAALPVKRAGDYVLAIAPAPYFEASEDKYIQQFTKVIFNRRGLPTDWSAPAGLTAEIMPLIKPYNIPAGGSFSGCVVADGAPVPGAEIEVERMSAAPELDAPGIAQPDGGAMPGGAITLLAGPDGCFSFALPRAGWWGFAALGVGGVTEHEGKELSQDAVMWVRAWAMDGDDAHR